MLLTDHSDINIVFVAARDKIRSSIRLPSGHLHPGYDTVVPNEDTSIRIIWAEQEQRNNALATVINRRLGTSIG